MCYSGAVSFLFYTAVSSSSLRRWFWRKVEVVFQHRSSEERGCEEQEIASAFFLLFFFCLAMFGLTGSISYVVLVVCKCGAVKQNSISRFMVLFFNHVL